MAQQINKSLEIPQHIAIILDGNRRWAQKQGVSRFEGHLEGANNLGRITKVCAKRGIKILTAFAFSTENQKRSKEEKDELFKIFRQFMRKYREDFKKNSIRLKVLGDISYFPSDLQEEITKTINYLQDGKKFQLNMALNYGGRADIVQAVKKVIKSGIKPDDLSEDLISKNLYTGSDPEPSMIVRPGGEMRFSNFLIWQASYSELYFTGKFWPEFDEKELDKAIEEYNKRERRFGK
jgi:undecaprenyl diphosphate synthase